MSIQSFIPTIWSARLLDALERNHVYGGLVNRDYEGDIKDIGDSVRINTIGAITIGDYTRNTDTSAPETLTGIEQTLTVDRGKYFNFQIDDVDKAQSVTSVMETAMRKSGTALADIADKFIASFYTDAAAANLIGSDATPITPTSANAYDYLVDLGVKLDEADVPASGRWVVVPAWYHGLLLKDNRFVTATESADRRLRTGEIGEAAGFTVYKSNNVPNDNGTKYKVMAGHNLAISFVQQITKVEAYRPERRFADAVKGLHVYGAKVLVPEGLAVMTANKA